MYGEFGMFFFGKRHPECGYIRHTLGRPDRLPSAGRKIFPANGDCTGRRRSVLFRRHCGHTACQSDKRQTTTDYPARDKHFAPADFRLPLKGCNRAVKHHCRLAGRVKEHTAGSKGFSLFLN